ncbi:unnamed protein product [Rotaria socialis]|uniref:Uncharacterized protein n=1 Tax=Rotaria socialis TaxID=392032 RepID=A0A818A7B3_9BILA|nr:unnamed protein product [Rotaria socialis]
MSQTKSINTRVTDENSIVRSSIPLEVLCHIHRPIVFLWFVAEILIFVWKGLIGWPSNWTIYELIIYANLTEQLFHTMCGFLLTLISIVSILYWTIWQWLVLKLEFVLGCSQLGLCFFELILVITAFMSFCKKSPKQKTD